MKEESAEQDSQETESDPLLAEFAKGGSTIPSSDEILTQMLDSKEGKALNDTSDE